MNLDFYFRETCTLIFLIVKRIFFMELVMSWCLFVELAVCWFLFMKHVACWFFSIRETFTLIFLLVKLILFMKPVACKLFSWNLLRADIFVRGTYYILILFVKLVTYWFFPSWNFYTDFSHCSDFVHVTRCMLIFFLFWNLIHAEFCLWNLLYFDSSDRETCTLIFLLVKLILFMELVECWFCSWNLLRANFYSLNLLYVDYSLRETCTLIFSHRETDFVH